MILVDTSVWVGHLRSGNRRLADLLERNIVLMHPMVLGELACGNLRDRGGLLGLWRNLPASTTATDTEALLFLEHHKLMGQGIGFIDVHLLAGVALYADATLWTRDKRLEGIAGELDIAYVPA